MNYFYFFMYFLYNILAHPTAAHLVHHQNLDQVQAVPHRHHPAHHLHRQVEEIADLNANQFLIQKHQLKMQLQLRRKNAKSPVDVLKTQQNVFGTKKKIKRREHLQLAQEIVIVAHDPDQHVVARRKDRRHHGLTKFTLHD